MSPKVRKLHTMLRAVGACAEAVKWSRDYPDLQSAWDACPRADWMLWLCGATNTHGAEAVRLAFAFADRSVRVDAVAALRSAADAPDIPAEHAATLRGHADALAALAAIDSEAAAWAVSAAAGAARDADNANAVREAIPSVAAILAALNR